MRVRQAQLVRRARLALEVVPPVLQARLVLPVHPVRLLPDLKVLQVRRVLAALRESEVPQEAPVHREVKEIKVSLELQEVRA